MIDDSLVFGTPHNPHQLPRGYPFRPRLDDRRASCGSVVCATLLGVDTLEADGLMDRSYERGGWNGLTNIGHIRAALKLFGLSFNKSKAYDGSKSVGGDWGDEFPVALFIQIEGPWIAKGWRSSYNHTHWALLHQGWIMDIMNRSTAKQVQPWWVAVSDWEGFTMPALVEYEKGSGWSVKGAYYVSREDPEPEQPEEKLVTLDGYGGG